MIIQLALKPSLIKHKTVVKQSIWTFREEKNLIFFLVDTKFCLNFRPNRNQMQRTSTDNFFLLQFLRLSTVVYSRNTVTSMPGSSRSALAR